MEILILAPNGALEGLAAAFHRALGEGGRVKLVEDAASLTRRLAKGKTDLVVLDYELGDGETDGAAILVELRRHYHELPIVAVGKRADLTRSAEAIRKGATEFLVRSGPHDERVEILLLKLRGFRQLMEQNRSLQKETDRLHKEEDQRYRIVGESPQMQEVMSRVMKVAKIPRPVLIQGERGTGKELVARAIHRAGVPAETPFVPVNCAALADTLLESELFGHEKGAFTGAASTSQGKFEQASGGTLFLDEIGNMSLGFQRKILRVVEYNRFTRVGGNKEIAVATRIIAATNADLQERIRKGGFLPDLYDRLTFEVIRVPPLREREGEIEVLARYFLDQFMIEVPTFAGKRLSREAVDLLHRYPFPGNVRELKNIIERAVYRDTTNELTPEDIGMLPEVVAGSIGGSFKERISNYERQILTEALQSAGGNQSRAARKLGLRYHQFRHYLKKHAIT